MMVYLCQRGGEVDRNAHTDCDGDVMGMIAKREI